MKKFFSLLAVGVLTLSLAACGQTEGTCDTEEDFNIALVTDIGGIDDKSFNQGTWEGVLRFAKGYDLCKDTGYKYLQSTTAADYKPNLTTVADQGMSLIVAPGYLFANAMSDVADAKPNSKFLIIDMVVTKDNVASAVFSEHEGSFLAGVAAALKAKEDGKDKVGFIGGMEGEIIGKFEAGFVAGVNAVDSNIEVEVQYVGSFDNAQIAQTTAKQMYDAGVYVIYQAAGSAGNGVIKEAKNRALNDETVWVIGVDRDQYEDGIYEDDNSVILTSMMKRVDLAAYEVARLTYEGKFPGGRILTFDLSNDGVGLPANNPNLSADIIEKVNEYRLQIIDGEIDVPLVPAE